MKWTKEKPKEDGYYWLKREGKNTTIVDIYDVPNDPTLAFFGSDMCISMEELEELKSSEWYGPLKPPEDEETETFAALWSTFWDSLVIGDGDYDMEVARKLCKLAGLEDPI